jgi:hypothetical protein
MKSGILRRHFLLAPMVFLLLFNACTSRKALTDEQKYIDRIKNYNEKGYRITNLHSHLKGGLSIEQLLEDSEKTGIVYGVAANCGIGFPIQNDSALSAYYHSMKDKDVYLGMQAEGREWIGLFSPDSIALFDYVFTDAMTFTDLHGNRTRLWIPEEVFVTDVDSFMEHLVVQIETILKNEPIDIYVNPTYLPQVIVDRYDELWKPEYITRVVNALNENQVALEINSNTKLPSMKVIKEAKKAGIRFTIGTNNVDSNIGSLNYALDMIDSCGLVPADFWFPEE